jgi:hypothetical protein
MKKSMKIFMMSAPCHIVLSVKSRRVRLAGHVACMGKRRNEYRHLFGEPEG